MYEDNLKHVGNIAVIRAMKYFAEKGYSILLPMGDYQKYDLVVKKHIGITRKHRQYLVNSSSSNIE